MPILLFGRGLAGVGSAGITATSRIIIADVRSLDNNSVQAAVMVTMQGLGFIVGPLIGGSISGSSGGWRWIFIMNIPIGGLSVALLWALLRNGLVGPQTSHVGAVRNAPYSESQPSFDGSITSPPSISQKLAQVDWLGAFLLVLASILILFGLSSGSTCLVSSAWGSPTIFGSLLSGSLLIMVFPAVEWCLRANTTYRTSASVSIWQRVRKLWYSHTKAVQPMLPLELFRFSDVWITYFNAMTGGMLLFSLLYFLSTYYVVVAGYGATKSGVQLLVLAPGLGGFLPEQPSM
jgi:MFS family permease